MEQIPENVNRILDETASYIEEDITSLAVAIKRVECDLSEESIEKTRCATSSFIVQYNIVKFLRDENDNFIYSSDIIKYFDAFIISLMMTNKFSKEDLFDLIILFLKKVKRIDTSKVCNDLSYVIFCCFYEIFDIHKINFVCDVRKIMNGDFTLVSDWLYDHFNVVAKKTDSIAVDYRNITDELKEMSSLIDQDIDTFENIIKLSNLMSSLGFSSEVIDIVKKNLLKKYKENNKKPVKEIKPIIIKREVHKSDLITDKEYKSILKEIRKYFNPYTNTLNVEELSDEERNHVLSLMVKIGIDKYSIMRFMNLTEKDKKEDYDYFKDHIEEYDYYYQEYMDTLMDYYNESLKCNPDEVEFWKDEINRILDNLKYDGKLYSYEYEIRLVKQSLGSN